MECVDVVVVVVELMIQLLRVIFCRWKILWAFCVATCEDTTLCEVFFFVYYIYDDNKDIPMKYLKKSPLAKFIDLLSWHKQH